MTDEKRYCRACAAKGEACILSDDCSCYHAPEEHVAMNPTPLAEPVFVLRAQDRCAPAAVRDWAHRARGLGASEAKVEGAMNVALEMEAWQRLHGCKTPD